MDDTRTVSRRQAAGIIGVHIDTLKTWGRSTPLRGPAFRKIGERKQSRTLYPLAEIVAWQADPQGYERRRQGGQHHADRRPDR